jgi:hypothetical protein
MERRLDMKTKGLKTRKFLRVLGFVIILFVGFSVNSFAAEKMWKGLAPVVQPDGSIKFVDRPIPESDVPPGVPPDAVGVWGWKDESFNFERVPPLDTSNWKGEDYYEYYTQCMGQVIKPAKDYSGNCGNDLEDKHGRRRIQRLNEWLRMFHGEGGLRYKKMLNFISPPEVKGMSYLSFIYSDPTKANDIWLYIPALRKVRRLAPASKMDSFAGTDLYTETVIDKSPIYWDISIIGEETIDANKAPFKDTYGVKYHYKKMHGKHCVILKNVPKDKDWPIGSYQLWMEKKTGLSHYEEWYDKAGRRIKTLLPYIGYSYPKNRTYVTFGDWLCQDLRTQHKSNMTLTGTGNAKINYETRDWSNYVMWYDIGVPEEYFTTRFMERGVR